MAATESLAAQSFRRELKLLSRQFFLFFVGAFLILAIGSGLSLLLASKNFEDEQLRKVENLIEQESSGIGLEIFLNQMGAFEMKLDRLSSELSQYVENPGLCLVSSEGGLISGAPLECSGAELSGMRSFAINENNLPIAKLYLKYSSVRNRGYEALVKSLREGWLLPTAIFLLLAVLFFFAFRILSSRLLKRVFGLKRELDYADLARTIGHDLKTPVASAALITHSLAKGLSKVSHTSDKEELVTQVKDLDLCLSHIRALAHDIHRGSYFEKASRQSSSEDKANSKARSANFTVETLGEILEEVIRSKRVLTLSLQEGARGIGLEMAFDLAFSRLGISKTDFSRIVGNLIDNAIAASAVAIRPVRISVERMSSQDVCVRVIDHGCGIESAMLEKVRERGFTTKSGGQGIGLFNVEKLCQSWGCDFKLQSQEGEMTNAILSFPLTTPKLKLRENLVIVDDDPLMIENLKTLLEDMGFRGGIRSFESPDKFSLWIRNNPSLKTQASFLLDYRFDNNPNTNGLELIREHGLEDCAAVVTGMALDQDVARACEKLGLVLIDKAEISSENFILSKRLSFVQFS